MTPELEEILNPIGWAKARHHPFAMGWRLTLQPNGGLIAANPQDAEAAKDRILSLWNAMQSVLKEIDNLPAEARRSINLASTPPDERDGGWPDHLASATSALRNVEDGLLTWATGLNAAAAMAAPNRPKNEPAYRVTDALAEIYLVGMGRKPGRGRVDGKRTPSTTFGKTVRDVLAALCIEVKDVYPICRAAIEKLTEERQRQLRNPPPFQAPSLYDFWSSRK